MNQYVTGAVIKELREKQHLTQDPYSCITELSPRYKNEEDVAQYRDEVAEENVLPTAAMTHDGNEEEDHATMLIPSPPPMENLPIIPLEI